MKDSLRPAEIAVLFLLIVLVVAGDVVIAQSPSSATTDSQSTLIPLSAVQALLFSASAGSALVGVGIYFLMAQRLMARISRLEEQLRHREAQIDALISAKTDRVPIEPVPTSWPRLHQALISLFTEEELKTLASDVGVDYDALPGEDKRGRASAFIARASSRGVFSSLIEAVNHQRPNANL